MVVNLLSLAERRRVRVRVQLPEADPRLPSIYELHPGSEAMERETYDMFGIVFDGHPDLSRILMPDDWEGHPLRKDYGIGRIPVQFKHPSGATMTQTVETAHARHRLPRPPRRHRVAPRPGGRAAHPPPAGVGRRGRPPTTTP